LPGRPGEGAGASDSDWAGPTAWADSESAPWADPARPGEAEGGAEDPWAAATAADTPPSASTGTDHAGTASTTSGAGGSSAGETSAGEGGAGHGGAGAGERERSWREWSGTAGAGRFATQADWESARESVRDLGSSARRLAAQAGDAARDPHVRDSAQRAARSLGDAIVTTVEDFATDLRNRMRNPRWSDPSDPAERPPVAPIENDHEDKP
jgi:hypothetical protein